MLPDLLKRTRTSRSVRIPMSPCRASTGDKNMDLIPRETSVCEILLATKPDLPTPVKKMVPPPAAELRRVWVKDKVWERSRCLKK